MIFRLLHSLLLSVIFLFAGIPYVHAQFIHIGVGGSAKRMDFVSGEELGDSTYTFYFSNTENETLRFAGFERQNKFFFNPAVYAQYSAKNNFFAELNFSVNRPTSVVKYDNSVPLGLFNQTFNSTFDSLNNASQVDPDREYSYEKLTLKWTFLETSLSVGYRFLRTKLVRPSIHTGIAVRYRLAMNLSDYPDDPANRRGGRTQVLYENLDTFRNWTFYYSIGVGLKYHQVSLNAFWGFSLGGIDINGKSQTTDFSTPDDSPIRNASNYLTADLFGISLGIDLITLNLTKKDVKQKIRTFLR